MIDRLWSALSEVEDPEIPVSVVDMGLIVSLDYSASDKAARLQITYTAMGCPAMDMIQDDIRARLLREDGVEQVAIEVVWDPVWTPARLGRDARARLRDVGLSL
jgi:metal-sulfur cluster biosynthetic enzyme